jgi:hypothetical protein
MFLNMSLRDYVTRPDWDWNTAGYWSGSTRNLQTRMISGTTSDDLESAVNNLRQFSVVGTTERFDETLRVVVGKLGWRVGEYERMNVTCNKPLQSEVSQEVIRLVERKNEKDMLLHELANHLLDEQLASLSLSKPE